MVRGNYGKKSGYILPVDQSPLAETVAGDGMKRKEAGNGSWILMNSSGEEMVLDLEKYAIMQRVQIHARDLRILDPLLSYPSTILGRERAIVVNLEHIKAIITAKEILLRDTLDDNIIPVVEELRRHLKPTNANPEDQSTGKDVVAQDDVEMGEEDESPFEFRALEVALEAICNYLAARTIELETASYPALDMLTSKISSSNLDQIRKLKSQMTRLTTRAQKVKDVLGKLLDDDGDMAELYLSRKLGGASSPTSGSGASTWVLASPIVGAKISKASKASVAAAQGNDVGELEKLLETYFIQIDGTLNKLTMLHSYIYYSEEYINFQLDTRRNQLIKLDIYLTAGIISLDFYNVFCSWFATQIPFSWNDNSSYMFKWVVLGMTLLSGLLFLVTLSYVRYRGVRGL